MTLCTSGMPGGINIDCLAYISPLDNVIITDVDVFFTEAQLKLMSQWKAKIQTALSVWIPSIVEGYERTSDEPTINTTGIGRKTMVRKPSPSGLFYLRANICDYNEIMRAYKGSTKRVWFVLADGTLIGYRDPNADKVWGFKGEINAATGGVPIPDAIENAFPLWINFMNYFEFESQYAFKPDWSVQGELPTAMPQSYSMRFISGTQATATIVVNIFERCGDAVGGLAIADVEVIDSTLTDDTVLSVTDNGDGNYSIAFTTAALNQDIKFRIKESTATIVDALSNPLYHEFIA